MRGGQRAAGRERCWWAAYGLMRCAQDKEGEKPVEEMLSMDTNKFEEMERDFQEVRRRGGAWDGRGAGARQAAQLPAGPSPLSRPRAAPLRSACRF